jgi:medium-chain acyl-[acyl-carrier-protein] hydrolase
MMPKEFELFALRLPGRESRIVEKPLIRLSILVEKLANVMEPFFDRPFAFYGHSMGALIAFELALYLRKNGLMVPSHLFVAAGRAPHLVNLEPPYYDLPENQFLEKLKRYRGMPAEILQNADLMEFIMPALRADMEMLQTYSFSDTAPLSCPISVFGGMTDVMVTQYHLEAWEKYTRSVFGLNMFETGHFFSADTENQMLRILTAQFMRTMEEI